MLGEQPAVVIAVPGEAVPWAAKAVSQKTGNRFIPARQADAIGRILEATQRVTDESFSAGTPLRLRCDFWVKRPKSHYGTGRNAGTIKPAHVDARPCGRPDLSNLVKLLEDGLVLAGLIPDDDQVVYIEATKFYTQTREEQPRSVVRVQPA